MTKLVLSEGQGPDVVVPEDMALQGLQILALDEELGYLCLDSHSFEIRHESVADILLSLLLPFADAHVLGGAHSQQLIEGLPLVAKQALDKPIHCDGLLRSHFEGVEVFALQSELVVIECHVGLVEHLFLLNTFLPGVHGILQHIILALVPASQLSLVSLLAALEHAPQKLPRARERQPPPLEELQQDLPSLKLLAARSSEAILEQAREGARVQGPNVELDSLLIHPFFMPADSVVLSPEIQHEPDPEMTHLALSLVHELPVLFGPLCEEAVEALDPLGSLMVEGFELLAL